MKDGGSNPSFFLNNIMKNMKLFKELYRMNRSSLEDIVNNFMNVRDISFSNINVRTVIDGKWALIDELALFNDDDDIVFICKHINDDDTVPIYGFQYTMTDIPHGGLMDLILTLEKRLK